MRDCAEDLLIAFSKTIAFPKTEILRREAEYEAVADGNPRKCGPAEKKVKQ